MSIFFRKKILLFCFVHYVLCKSAGVSALHIIEELGKRQLVDLKPKMYLPDFICKLINNNAESALHIIKKSIH